MTQGGERVSQEAHNLGLPVRIRPLLPICAGVGVDGDTRGVRLVDRTRLQVECAPIDPETFLQIQAARICLTIAEQEAADARSYGNIVGTAMAVEIASRIRKHFGIDR